VVGWVGGGVEVMGEQGWSETARDGAGCGRRLRNGRFNAAEAQDAAAIRGVPVVVRGRRLLVGAAVRTADAIDRVQGREEDQHRGDDESSHALIMHRLRHRHWSCRAGKSTCIAVEGTLTFDS
jgi:hypothetical protein